MPIYWAFLTYILLRPLKIKSERLWIYFEGMDKLVHVSSFVVLSFCYLLAFPRKRFLLFVGLMLGYALITEILQEVMGLGRSFEVIDFVADAGGVMIAYLIWRKIFNLKD